MNLKIKSILYDDFDIEIDSDADVNNIIDKIPHKLDDNECFKLIHDNKFIKVNKKLKYYEIKNNDEIYLIKGNKNNIFDEEYVGSKIVTRVIRFDEDMLNALYQNNDRRIDNSLINIYNIFNNIIQNQNNEYEDEDDDIELDDEDINNIETIRIILNKDEEYCRRIYLLHNRDVNVAINMHLSLL